MSKLLDSRIYGVIGVKSILANWNADFTQYPRSLATGEVFGSNKALKYPMKRMWQEKGDIVLGLKSYRVIRDGDLIPNSLLEKYEELFGELKTNKADSQTEVLKNLFSAIDVKNFGVAFAVEKVNLSINGAVQITNGFNKYDEHDTVEMDILSPYRNPKDTVDKKTKDVKVKQNTSIGSKIVSTEAHYSYGFFINPYIYDDFVKLEVTDGYTEDDYKKFKEAALVSATVFNSDSKVGCENEFAVFIEGDSNLYLPDLAQFITFEKSHKDTINLNFDDLINDMGDRIKSVEVYYNDLSVDLICNIDKAKMYNIYTMKEI